MTTIEKAIKVMSDIVIEGAENPHLQNLIANNNVSLPLSVAVKYGFANLTDEGREMLLDTFEYLEAVAESMGIPEVSELIFATEEVPTRRHTITVQP